MEAAPQTVGKDVICTMLQAKFPHNCSNITERTLHKLRITKSLEQMMRQIPDGHIRLITERTSAVILDAEPCPINESLTCRNQLAEISLAPS
jgi:hypothetical protein